MAELIERELLSHSLAQHLVQGLVIGDENLNEAMKGLDSSAFLHGFEYAMNLAQTIVCNRPTTTKSEIRAMAIDELVERIKIHVKVVGTTYLEDIDEIAEQLKEE